MCFSVGWTDRLGMLEYPELLGKTPGLDEKKEEEAQAHRCSETEGRERGRNEGRKKDGMAVHAIAMAMAMAQAAAPTPAPAPAASPSLPPAPERCGLSVISLLVDVFQNKNEFSD